MALGCVPGHCGVKHAGPVALGQLSALLAQLRAIGGLREKKPGIFYRGASAFLHFHEDPAGLFADAKTSGCEFTRFSLSTEDDQRRLLTAVAAALGSKDHAPTPNSDA